MKTREEIEGSRVTIDVALLRELAAWPNTSLVAYGPVVLLKPTTVTELLDAYEERDRLREALEETREQLERDFAIRCRCDFVTGLFAGIERCVGCRARDRIAAIERALGTTEASHA